jgi:surface protein
MFIYCNTLTTIPNFNTSKVTNMYRVFGNCKNIKGNLYIESNNVTDARNIFVNTSNKYTKNIYVHANTTTYHTIYANMGNTTYNSNWNVYLKTF